MMPDLKRKQSTVVKPEVLSLKLSADSDVCKVVTSNKRVKISQNEQKMSMKNELVEDDSFRRMKVRSTPTQLALAMTGLSEVKQQALRDVGFGSIVGFNISNLPGKLVYYIVDNFDPQTMVIKTGRGDIACDRDAVFDVFGIPKGDTVILDSPSLEKSDFVTTWSNQFKVSSKCVRNKMVCSRITGDFAADNVFIMNVLMLFVNTMVFSSVNGYNLDVLHHVDINVDMRSYDWCGFLLHYLKLSKENWNRESPDSNPYSGPARFLCLLYLDRTKCDSLPVIRERPIFKNWVGLMKARENKEVENGGFGQLDLFPIVDEKEEEVVEAEGFFEIDKVKNVSCQSKEDYYQFVSSKIEDALKIRNLLFSSIKDALLKFPVDVTLTGYQNKISEIYLSKEADFEDKKDDVEQILGSVLLGLSKYGKSEGMNGDDYVDFDQVNLDSDDYYTSPVVDVSLKCGKEGTKLNVDSEVMLFESCEKKSPFNCVKSTIKDVANDDHVYDEVVNKLNDIPKDENQIAVCTNEEVDRVDEFNKQKIVVDTVHGEEEVDHVKESQDVVNQDAVDNQDKVVDFEVSKEQELEHCSQWWNENIDEICRTCDKSLLNLKRRQLENSYNIQKPFPVDDAPSFNILTPTPPKRSEFVPEVSGISSSSQIVEAGRVKRSIKPSMLLKSPYVSRKSIVMERLSGSEYAVANHLFACFGNSTDTVFISEDGIVAVRVSLETLCPNLLIEASVVDLWGVLLNYEEKSRKVHPVHRLFLPTSVLHSDVLNSDKRITLKQKMYQHFRQTLDPLFYANKFDLNKIDLVFIPVCRNRHFFLLVFDLRKPDLCIIDNIYSGSEFISKYQRVLNYSKQGMQNLLEEFGHKHAKVIGQVKHRLFKLNWQTKQNSVDCGVFIMRHMETYMGEDESRWDCELPKESNEQRVKLRRLRSRYASRILTHPMNKLAAEILQRAYDFVNVYDKEEIKQLVFLGLKNRAEREK